MSATVDDVMAELKLMRGEMKILHERVDGMDRYVRRVLRAEHRDTDHAEAELAESRQRQAELELEQIANLERHERSTRGGE